MLRRFLQRLNFVGRLRARHRAWREAEAFAEAFHRESRARVAELAAKGQGDVALAESVAALGIDLNDKERPKLTTVGGIKIVGYNGVRVRRD